MIRALTFAALVLVISSPLYAIPIGGIEFPAGAVSFADVVVSYTPGAGVGTLGPQIFDNPLSSLGVPDYTGNTGAVSLGRAVPGNPSIAELIVRFTDNSLTTSGTSTPDLHIFEVGADVEKFFIAISQDGTTWLDIGSLSGQPTSIDIDAVAGVVPGAKYSFVRLRDDPSVTSPFGVTFAEADIDAIGAISSSTPAPVPEPATLSLLLTGLFGTALAVRRGRSR